MMHRDPHEPAPRREDYAKDLDEEEMLAAMNASLEHAYIPACRRSAEAERLPIIYIVGAPRSGTTLLSQLLNRYLPLGYINNLIARFWLRPAVGIWLSQEVLGSNPREGIVFRSTHGVSEGVCGPHEFGYFWRHWLQLDRSPTHHLSAAALAGLDRAGLKHALEGEILCSFQSGVVFKNVICGFHASFLTALHPRSLFVHIKRDLFETAASILQSRRERFGSYEVWWSLKPSTYPFDLPPGDAAAEVARQVVDTRKEMEEELARPGVEAVVVNYRDLCAEPGGIIDLICGRLQAMGCHIRPVSTKFPILKVSAPPRLPPALESRLHECLYTMAER